MNNFTKGDSESFWHAITNLTCCSIAFRKWQFGVRSLMTIFFVAFSISSMYAQKIDLPLQRSTFYEVCMDQRPSGFTEEEIANLYASMCADGSTINVVKTENLSGTDCGWTSIYTFDITCGDFTDELKITYEGGDVTAPEITGDAPGSESGLNLCFDEIPVGPSEADIAAIYSDNCGNVNVIKTGEPQGTDCSWSVTYVYAITDDCGNQSENFEITYSGGDTEAPVLAKGAQLPEGETGLNLCYDDRPTGPTEAEVAALFVDNCGNINVEKAAFFKGDDCGWKGEILYTVTDDCGNAAEVISLYYNGGDMEAPVFVNAPEDMTVSCIDEVPEKVTLEWTDNCTYGSKGNYSSSVDNYDNLGVACEGGTVVRTWTAVDNCGHTTEVSQVITVLPAPKPEFEMPQDYTIDCGDLATFQAQSLAYSNGVDGGACDVSGLVLGVAEDFSGSCGSFTVNYAFTDECGYTITASQTVTVEDNEAPVIEPGKNETVECDGAGNVEEYQAWLESYGDASATDNCGNITWSYTETTDVACGGDLRYFVDFVATDDCGNSSVWKGVFHIKDSTPPVVVDAQDMMVECDGQGNLTELQAWLNNNGGASATDACSDFTWSNNFEAVSDDCGMTGAVTVTFYATDACDNVSETTATFTIQDTTAPEITDAQDMTVECDGQGNMAELDAWLANNGGATASDVCGDVTWSNNFEALSDACGMTGSATVEFTATDACGNESKTTATFTIEDTNSPPITMAAQNMTVECDGEGNMEAYQAWLNNNGGATAVDICSDITWSYQVMGETDDCGMTKTITVLFTVTDDCGLSSSTEADFIIEDTTAPEVIAAQDVTVECKASNNDNRSAEISIEQWLDSNGGASASDLCGDVTWTNNFNGLSDDCGNTGSATVEFTATDACGNASTTTATYTIVDTTAPTIEIMASDMTVECDGAGNNEELMTWLDNNGGAAAYDICGDITWSNNFDALSDDCGMTGSATVEFTATDDCGNETKTTATFTIVDTTDPEITDAMDMTVECDGQGNMAELDAWLASNGGAYAYDVCSDITWSNNFNGLSDDCGATGSATVEFTVTDDCGNESKATATFTIEDTTNPSIDYHAKTEIVECDGAGNLEELAAWLESNGGALASDYCGDVTWSNDFNELTDECGMTGSVTVVFTVADECGNTSKTQADFIIEDTVAPEVTDAMNMTVECDGQGNMAELDAWLANNGGATASDICGNVTWSNNFEALSDDCGMTGSATVTFTATDDCGNASTTTAVFTIEDTTAPSIDEEAKPEIVECDGQGNMAELNAWLQNNGGAIASDICGDVTWSNNFEALSDDCGMTGSATVEFTATDACGNTSKTSATFTIEDTTDPEITDAMDQTVECSASGTDMCTYTLQGFDSFGDGWNGAALDVYVNGVMVATYTFTSYSYDGEVMPIMISNGDTISLQYSSLGGYPEEISYVLNDSDGAEAASGLDAGVEVQAVCPVVLSSDELFAQWLANNGGATASDLCGDVTWSNNSQGLSDDCGATGSETVEFTATDACGNTSKTTATFTIIDTVAPSIDEDAQDMTVECDGNGNMAELQAWLDANAGAAASDLCSDVTWSNDYDSLSDDCGATGSATVTFTATDECGNSSTTTATFTIEDTTEPMIDLDAQDMTVECDGQGNMEQLQMWLDNNAGAMASDMCGDVTWSNDYDSLSDDCGATGSATVVFTATDDCGNASTTMATFTIVDTTAPTVDPAKDMTVECDGEGNVADLEAWIASNGGAMASDDCSDVTWSYNCGEPTLVNSGSTSGVNEEDASIPDNNDDGITTIANVSGIPAGATIDNITVDVSIEHTWVGDLGIELIAPSGESLTLLAHPGTEDGAGDSSNSSAAVEGTITFMDSASTLGEDMGATILGGQTICIDDGICEYIPDTGNVLFADLIAQMITNGADPNGDWSLKVIDRNLGDLGFYSWAVNIDWSLYEAPACELSDECGATGSVTVNFVATDDCGNSSTTTATFTVVDTTAPSVVDAQDMTVECDGQGNVAELQAWLENNGGATASDDCSEFTWSNNFEALSDDCGMTGSATVEFTVTDECGNASKTTATFTIEDTTAPSIDYEAEDMTVECDGSGNVDQLNAWLASNAGAMASDVCSEFTWTHNFNGLSDDCGETGSATVEFTVTDECGNASKTTATFTIEDTTAPSIDEEAKPEIVECDGNGNMAELQAWLDSNGGAMASDTCSGVTWSNNYDMLSDDCGATGSVTVEFTATDDCGNSAKTSATFTIEDTIAPVLVGQIPQGESDVNVCFDMIPQGPTEAEIAALFYEACGEVVVEKTGKALGDDCSWAVMYTYVVADECGNPYGDVKVWYNGGDTSAPTFNEELPADMTVECDSVPDAAVLTATDNCADVIVEFDEQITDGSCKGEYTIVRSWSVVDNCDNATSHVQTINVIDTTAPVLVGTIPNGENQIDACLSGAPEGPTEEEIAALFSDACGDVVVVKETQTWGDDCSWIVNHEYTVTDDCGNVYDGQVKVYYQGSDQSAPEFETACLDQIIEIEYDCPADASISLNEGDVIDPYIGWTVAGYQAQPLGDCVSDDCTLMKDIVLRVMDISYGGDSCQSEISISFEAEDACGNKSDEWLTRTYVIKDVTAPVLECPDGQDFGVNPALDSVSGLPYGLTDKVPYADSCQADGYTFDYTDEISSSTSGGQDMIQFYTNPSGWYIDYTLVGYDSYGYPMYEGVFNWPDYGIYGNSYSYPLTYNHVYNQWEAFEGSTFIFGQKTLDSTPSCDLADWYDCGCLTAPLSVINCSTGQGSIEEYTLVRTFTANDGCGNVGECSITYTWTIDNSNNIPPAAPQTNSGNEDLYTATSLPSQTAPEADKSMDDIKLDFTAYPVPFDREVTIKYNFEFETHVSIDVYDTKGLLVLSETNNNYRAGSDASVRLDLSNGADQLFYVTVTTSQGSVTKKIVSSSLKRR